MDRELKIEIVIIDLSRKILNISDKVLLNEIHSNLKKKNIHEKEIILNKLLEKDEYINKVQKNTLTKIRIAENKILEFFDKKEDRKNLNIILK